MPTPDTHKMADMTREAAATDPGEQEGTGTLSATGKADKGRAGKHARAALGRGLHGEWVVKGKDGKPVTLVSVRGTVTAVGPASVTVKADDGFTATFATSADTKVRGGADSLAAVKAGAKAAVVGVKSAGTTTARAIFVRK